MNSYVDFEDYANPIKTYFDDRHSYKGVPAFTKRIKLYAKENLAEFSDNIVQIGSAEEHEFISVEKSDFDMETFSSNNYFEVSIVLDPEKVSYQRVVFSMFDLSGMLGGLFEILTILCGFMVRLYSKHSFYFSAFPNLYQVEQNARIKNTQISSLSTLNDSRKIVPIHLEETKKKEASYDKDGSRVGTIVNLMVTLTC
jgi:hypothetical protein